MKVLLELRPALDGWSGIPQETRLLFRGLAGLDDVRVAGLLQSSNLVLPPGLPQGKARERLSNAEAVDRMSKVVIAMQQGAAPSRVHQVRRRLLKYAGPVAAWFASWVGRRVSLGGFDASLYRDFLWRALFAKSLPPEDLDRVLACEFRVLRWPWGVLHAAGFASSTLGRAQYLRLDTSPFNVFVAETPLPARVSRRTRLVVRYHDAIPLLMPHTIKDRGYHRAAHYHALRRNVRDGAWFACVSDATRRDLLSVYPELGDRAVTIPNMVPEHFHPPAASAERIPEIVWSRKNRLAPLGGGAPIDPADLVDGHLRYILVVGTIEPRKNHLTLLDAWEHLRHEGFPNLHLVVVGSFGWEHDSIGRRFAPWLERGGMHLLEAVPVTDLRMLYRHAVATVCPSYGEGFDFPGIEAMRCGGVVAASDLPVHADVFGSACEYFSPYDAVAMAAAIRRLLDDEGGALRERLVAEGARVSERYLPERVMPEWHRFLQRAVAA